MPPASDFAFLAVKFIYLAALLIQPFFVRILRSRTRAWLLCDLECGDSSLPWTGEFIRPQKTREEVAGSYGLVALP